MKNVIIHFGPPKTGTSALQHWLVKNHELLLQHGIFYPVHDADRNGISSGNDTAIFPSRDAQPEEVRQQKQKLLKACRQHRCSTLLLSSESFLRRLPRLAKLFPTARFIGYVRAPIDLLESGYNQGVKRSGETRLFSLEERGQINHLHKVTEAISAIGRERFILRAYASSAFTNGDIVCDFMHSLFPSFSVKDVSVTAQQINLSYTLEVLETMRWLNSVISSNLTLTNIDRVLQHVDYGQRHYSFLTPQEYEVQRQLSLNDIDALNKVCPIFNVNELTDELLQKKQKPYVQQKISNEAKTTVLNKLFAELPNLKERLFKS